MNLHINPDENNPNIIPTVIVRASLPGIKNIPADFGAGDLNPRHNEIFESINRNLRIAKRVLHIFKLDNRVWISSFLFSSSIFNF